MNTRATSDNVTVGTKLIIDPNNTRYSHWGIKLFNSHYYNKVDYFQVTRIQPTNNGTAVTVEAFDIYNKIVVLDEDVLCIGYDGYYDAVLYSTNVPYDIDNMLNNLDKIQNKLPKKKWWKIF